MKILTVIFSLIFILMSAVTIWASLEEGVWAGFNHVVQYRWGWATLADAYFGFLTFYCWVFYRERQWPARAAWFVGIFILGNLAMSVYVLLQIRKKRPLGAPL